MNLYQNLDYYLFRSIDLYGTRRPSSDLFIWPYDNSIRVMIHSDHLSTVQDYLGLKLVHLLLVYASDGKLVGEHLIEATNEVSSIISSYQSSLSNEKSGLYGTFSLFHFSLDSFGNFKLPTLAEKSICSYYLPSEDNICLMHGNLNERVLGLTSHGIYFTSSNMLRLPFKRSYVVPIAFQPSRFKEPGISYNSIILKNSLDCLLEVLITFSSNDRIKCLNAEILQLNMLPLSTKVVFLSDYFPVHLTQFITIVVKTNLYMLRPILSFHNDAKQLLSIHHS